MSTKLKIKVTKEILFKSQLCQQEGVSAGVNGVGANCAIALAVRDIFPYAWISDDNIDAYYFERGENRDFDIPLPKEAKEFISDFDKSTPEERVKMPEIEFEVDISDDVLQKINIDEVKELLKNHPTLELI